MMVAEDVIYKVVAGREGGVYIGRDSNGYVNYFLTTWNDSD